MRRSTALTLILAAALVLPGCLGESGKRPADPDDDPDGQRDHPCRQRHCEGPLHTKDQPVEKRLLEEYAPVPVVFHQRASD